jgi:4-amino-4-deoxy-L-arabinose transferase-like glycosyltransferase
LLLADNTIDRAGLTALAVLTVALAVVVATWPALPIDETRYLTVAWEMRTSGNWSLPTLNFEPYSHKPPLLFWLINASWSLFGLAVWPARMVGAAAMAATLLLTQRLDRELAPDACPGPAASALMLLALPLFVVLGFSIMFDMLLTATVAGAMLALWHAGRNGGRAAFLAYGFCVGLGLLAKGPVVLLFTVPAALLARLWIDAAQQRGWFPRVGASLALAIGMGLAWALRAAYLGGPDYAEMLFWKQSAGRMAASFAHARAFWFYGPILLLFVAPLVLWRPAWIGLKKGLGDRNPSRNFLLCWILPALLGLTLISGKQLHYALPLLPALALLLSLGLRAAPVRTSDRAPLLVFAALLFIGIAALRLETDHLLPPDSIMASGLRASSMPLLIATGVGAIATLAAFGGSVRRTLLGLAIANLIVLIGAAAQSRATFTTIFDLQPVVDAIAPWRDRSIAVAQKTRGEFGFLARLTRPVVLVPEERLPAWLEQNPGGIAIIREKLRHNPTDTRPAGQTVIFRTPYRSRERITVIAATPPLSQSSGVDAAQIAPRRSQ